MPTQIEIVFDETSGKFLVHFTGVPTHAGEHRILDQLVTELKAGGFTVETEHYHEKPKLPEFNNQAALDRALKSGG